MKSTSALALLLASLVPTTILAMDAETPSLLSAYSSKLDSFSLSSVPASLPSDGPAISLAPYARAGWRANLSTLAHGVRGTVTIVDADTFRVDNFFYDGGGINVRFILAATDDNATFRNARLVTDLNLLGSPQNAGSLTIDLPAGSNFDGYGAVSLWCLPAQANFGSGTFVNPVPEPASTALFVLGAITLGSLRRRTTLEKKPSFSGCSTRCHYPSDGFSGSRNARRGRGIA